MVEKERRKRKRREETEGNTQKKKKKGGKEEEKNGLKGLKYIEVTNMKRPANENQITCRPSITWVFLHKPSIPLLP